MERKRKKALLFRNMHVSRTVRNGDIWLKMRHDFLRKIELLKPNKLLFYHWRKIKWVHFYCAPRDISRFNNLHVDFQDIHVMIFIGFGFLMTFLKRYGYSATGLNLFVAALCIQWAILMRGFFEMEDGTIKWVIKFKTLHHNTLHDWFSVQLIRLSLNNLIGADIAAASVLISMGALLGRISPIQLLVMGLFEIVLFASNEFLQIELMKVRAASCPGTFKN